MNTIRQMAQVYRLYATNCFVEAMSFRVHFILLVFMDLLFYLTTLATVDFIYNYVPSIGLWTRTEFMFFISFMLVIDHLHMTFISESFWNFSFEIRTGNLDFILLKPIPSLFAIFFRFLRPGTLVNIFFPWGCAIYFGLELGFGIGQWLLIPVFVVLGLGLLVSLEILLSMSMFWTVESFGINFLRMQLQQLSRWPDFIFKSFARKLFTIVIPVLLIGSIPTKILLQELGIEYILILAGAMISIWPLIFVFWRLGLRKYESASS